VLLVVCLLVYLLPSGLLAGGLLIAGMGLFYWAQKEGRWLHPGAWLGAVAGFGLLVGSLVMGHLFQELDISYLTILTGFGMAGAPVGILSLGVGLMRLLLPGYAGGLLVQMRRLQREQALRRAASESGTGSERYLETLAQTLDSRFEDVGLHLKYAEALFARGRHQAAAVEARLLLGQDPYHFNGNLLLANAYHALDLWDDAIQVCDRYLAVSGYCFEFSELREQSLRKRGVA
jgi:hypothetical protein